MRITRDDEDRLITVHFAWLSALGIATIGPILAIHLAMDRTSRWNIYIAIATMVISLVGANQFATRIVFDFDKCARNLIWTSRSLMRSQRLVIPFSEISSASVHVLNRNNMRFYRVELHTANGILPLSSGFSTGNKEDSDSIAERINFIVRDRAS